MADHRWDTEPPAILPSRLAARRRAAGNGTMFSGAEDPGANAPAPVGDGTVNDHQVPVPASVSAGDSGADSAADSQRPARRWRFPLGAGILAACLMLAAAAALPLLRDRDRDPVLSVEMGTDVSAGRIADTGEADPEGQDSPAGSPPPPTETIGPADTAGPAAEPGSAGDGLVVHVAGAVAAPGIVRIPEGGRVADAVAAAGGATADADLTRVNLAAPMPDGSMVVVPAEGDPAGAPVDAAGTAPGTGPVPGAGSPGGSPGTPGGSVVNLNTASEAELQTLPRVGPVLAARIITWRTEHGPFQRAEDLDAVPGIGEAMLAALLPLVVV
ncbi:ComEA family DNA-binding protein [Arthrobacter luteolus]|uniref:ComEA family DNA-binding protein n=1 Tax=Arthrobacter luteolus TaxID=98672 RepID=UPI00384B76C4